MKPELPSTGNFDLDLYVERMELSRVQRVIDEVRKLEESVGRRKTPDEVRASLDEQRRSLYEWAGL